MAKPDTLCKELASILGGKASSNNGICEVQVQRTDIDVTIMGISSPAVAAHMFIFQRYANNQRALNLGDLVLVQDEVPQVIRELANREITIGAVHNHWIFDEPHLIYVHVQAIMKPRIFAQRIAEVLAIINESRTPEDDIDDDDMGDDDDY